MSIEPDGYECQSEFSKKWLARVTAEREEGEARGRASTVIKLLQLKFGELPADVVARIDDASVEDLDRWAGRILFVERLEDLFV